MASRTRQSGSRMLSEYEVQGDRDFYIDLGSYAL
jgi:hypothetical protein